MELIAQGMILIILLLSIGYSFRYVLARHDQSLDWQQKGLLLLTLLTMMGGFLGSPFWWFDLEESFSWDLPPLASRMLAGAGWSFVIVAFFVLQKPTRRRLRLSTLMLSVYLTPLSVAIVLFHLDRFDFGKPLSYAFFLIVLGMVIPANWYLYRQPTIVDDEAVDSRVSSDQTRQWLWAIAGVTALWGLALFITDEGPSTLIWVWPGDLLTSRLIGVMLLTIAVGALISARYADVARLMLMTTAVYGLALVVATLWNLTADLPIKPAYVIVFGVKFIGSSICLYRDHSST